MGNHTQFGFLSVLLILLMFFAFQAFEPRVKALTVHRGDECPGICEPHCSADTARVTSEGFINYDRKVLGTKAFIDEIKLANMDCDIYTINIIAHSNQKHGLVVELSNEIKTAIPRVNIIWSVLQSLQAKSAGILLAEKALLKSPYVKRYIFIDN
jgi:hypothetical protein